MKKLALTLVLFLWIVTCIAQVITINHTYYTIRYDQGHKVPIYTSYTLTTAHANSVVVSNRSEFHADRAVPLENQAKKTNYLTSNNLRPGYTNKYIYDRGHLAPEADFRFDSDGEKESMVYTNVAPQDGVLNEALWQSLEKSIRNLAKAGATIKIFTGCLYDFANGRTLNGIPIPTHYWKVYQYHNEWYGYEAENKTPESNDFNTKHISVYVIKRQTGIDFNNN